MISTINHPYPNEKNPNFSQFWYIAVTKKNGRIDLMKKYVIKKLTAFNNISYMLHIGKVQAKYPSTSATSIFFFGILCHF